MGILLTGLLGLPYAWAQKPSLEQLQVVPLDAHLGKATIYKIAFVLTDTLPSDALVEVIFSEGFDLRFAQIAGSPTVNGGFAVEVDSQKVIVYRKGEGDPVPAGRPVELLLSLIKNPPGPDLEYSVLVSVTRKEGKVLAGPVAYKLRLSAP